MSTVHTMTANRAREIAKQAAIHLGGDRFIALTGAKFRFASDGSLYVDIPARMARHNVTRIVFEPRGVDTYHVDCQRLRRGQYESVEKVTFVAGRQLAEVFTDITGLRTHL